MPLLGRTDTVLVLLATPLTGSAVRLAPGLPLRPGRAEEMIEATQSSMRQAPASRPRWPEAFNPMTRMDQRLSFDRRGLTGFRASDFVR